MRGHGIIPAGILLLLIPCIPFISLIPLGALAGTGPQARPDRHITIVLDPGHGGHDPGAVGRTGLTEKEVVLDIAFRTKAILTRQPGRTVLLTRTTDEFVPLPDRVRLAKKQEADLFVSIHANSSPRRRTKGIEIFLLGRPSNRRALATAARENGTTEAEVSALEQILADLARTYNVEASLDLAHITREALKTALRRQYRDVPDLGVRRAPFYVLLHAGVPSALIEVAFLSNPVEEQRLGSSQYRDRLAEGLSMAIERFLAARTTGP